jgi:hypothetical protein
VSPDRRQFLGSAIVTGVAAIAGCVGGDGGSDDGGEETPTETGAPELQLGDRALRSVFPVRLMSGTTGEEVVELHWHDDRGHWHRQPVQLEVDSFRSLQFVAWDREDERIPVGEDEPYQIDVRRSEDTPADLVEVQINDDRIGIRGVTEGSGVLFVQIKQDGEERWLSPPLEVEVR